MIEELLNRIASLEKRLSALETENAALKAENAALKAENATLKAENADLRRRLGMDSTNSSKPPSSDGFKKKQKKDRSLRGVLKEGEKKEKSKPKPLNQTENPDETVEIRPESCEKCGENLVGSESEKIEKRQVFDLPPPKAHVIEYRSHAVKCLCCGEKTAGKFPDEAKAHVQFGPRTKALAAYFSSRHMLPEERMAEIFKDAFGMEISPSALASFVSNVAEKAEKSQEKTFDELQKAPCKHLDETGLYVAGKRDWLHVISDKFRTFYRYSTKRGEMFEGLNGVVSHDCWNPYYGMEKVEHSLCNAHILRELVAIIEHEKENWAKRMKRLLLRSHRLWKNGGDCPPRVEKSEILKKIYDRIVENALKHYESLPELKPKGKEKRGKTKRRAGHNLALRLQKRQDDVLRFLFDARAPFTNNQAERDLRMTKVKQKISGCFRSEKGAKNFATLYGFFSTARKQGKNPLAEIQALFAAA